ncbi:hypothetical protein BC936DRAFT_148745 [Jimgerdemannia flammicorona]|uniref:Uncharacterized protein n=2 Tax=Jimgerdemannia flammicorona TaxID=994334 RepID=A0A433DKE5_9FUNG|nr:hypothetical protein BC936DRAFT_148745 [Jimgerdemannia flammicorona]RUS30605.1 hypothetical protein BC938DRAFT_479188 [Jimgerdemannia flammicorona]
MDPLPLEITVEVIEYLKEDRRTLMKLASVNRTFCKHVRPLLFTKAKISLRHRLKNLKRYLCQDSEFARVMATECKYLCISYFDSFTSRTWEELGIVLEHLPNLTTFEISNSHTIRESQSLEMGLLLPNVTHLIFNHCDAGCRVIDTTSVSQRIPTKKECFVNVTHLTITRSSMLLDESMRVILIRLPNLTHFCLDHPDYYWDMGYHSVIYPLAEFSHKVRSLRFNLPMRADRLSDFLRYILTVRAGGIVFSPLEELEVEIAHISTYEHVYTRCRQLKRLTLRAFPNNRDQRELAYVERLVITRLLLGLGEGPTPEKPKTNNGHFQHLDRLVIRDCDPEVLYSGELFGFNDHPGVTVTARPPNSANPFFLDIEFDQEAIAALRSYFSPSHPQSSSLRLHKRLLVGQQQRNDQDHLQQLARSGRAEERRQNAMLKYSKVRITNITTYEKAKKHSVEREKLVKEQERKYKETQKTKNVRALITARERVEVLRKKGELPVQTHGQTVLPDDVREAIERVKGGKHF